jgi:hypothetical protein
MVANEPHATALLLATCGLLLGVSVVLSRASQRNGVPVPEGVFGSDDEFEWSDFLHFLRTYDLAASVIRTPEDYRDVTFEYLSSCAAEGAIYVEVIASPDHAAAVGLSDADHYAGIAQGIDDARDAHGIEARIVIAAIPHPRAGGAPGPAPRPPTPPPAPPPPRPPPAAGAGPRHRKPTRPAAQERTAGRFEDFAYWPKVTV